MKYPTTTNIKIIKKNSLSKVKLTIIIRTSFVLLSFLILINKCFAQRKDIIMPFAVNGIVGYNYGLDSKSGASFHSLDTDFIITFINGGFVNNKSYGRKGYIGIGLGSLLQFQYGYAYSQKKNLLRIRSDVPMTIVLKKGFWRRFSLRLYWEKRYNSFDFQNIYGFNISCGITNLMFSQKN